MEIVPKKIFREYDIRGVADEEITPHLAYLVGRAFGTEVCRAQGRTVCVGRDGRLSTPRLAQKLVEGLVDSGLQVKCLERGPTPMTYFASHTLGMDAALMITGSHNPGHHNGFKMVLKGRPFWGARLKELWTYIDRQDFVAGKGTCQDGFIFKAYTDYLVESYLSFYGDQRPLRVAWDPGNGAAGEVVSALVKRLPGEHIVINAAIDGHFPAHHPDPTVAKNLVQLQETVVAHGCDLGVAFDGDGDRLGVVDGKGRILWGDEFLSLLAEEVLQDHPGATIIADVKASQSFFEAVREKGGKPLMWKTGHSLIKEKMKEIQAPLAGEMSGHVFYADRYFGFDDGLYAALRLMGICASSSSSLADWYERRPKRVSTPEMRLVCEGQDKFQIVEAITASLESRALKEKEMSLDCTDGVRVCTDKGWWLLRASHTQDVLVVRAEAASQEDLTVLRADVQTYLTSFGMLLDHDAAA